MYLAMKDDEAFDYLIGILYETVMAPDLWQEAVAICWQYVDSADVQSLIKDTLNPALIISILKGIELSDIVISAYVNCFSPLDFSQNSKIGLTAIEISILNPAKYSGDHNPFYRHFFLNQCVPLLVNAWLDKDQLHYARRFSCHLQKALRLQNYTDHLHRQIKLCTIAIDTFTVPMLIVDGKGSIVHLNIGAMDLLDCGLNGLTIQTGCLTKSQNANKGRLATLITDATGVPALGGAMFLNSNKALQVFITPLIAESSIDSGLQNTLALVFVIDATKSQSLSTLNLLAKLYGFSATELKVASALLSGKSPEEYSRQNGASINTVRTQLKALFRKTGVRGQSELLVLLSRIPPLRD